MSETKGGESIERQAHVVLDEASRILKARKIVRLLGPDVFNQARRILEVGCGSGYISSTLAQMAGPHTSVYAVDVKDSRLVLDGYHFQLVSGTSLPFDDDSFDIVISNHVIEHVGDIEAQLSHLLEIKRVLNPSGSVYLAVPNRWRLVEPHYRLPLLSWFPHPVSDLYLRLIGLARHYDCEPLSLQDAKRLFEAAGVLHDDRTLQAVHATLDIEQAGSALHFVFSRLLPEWMPKLGMAIMPTLVFTLSKPNT